MSGSSEMRVRPPSFLRQDFGILFVATLLLVLGSFLVPLHGVWVTDCGLRYLQLINIVDRHHWGGFWFDYPLRELDPKYELAPFGRIQTFVHGDRLYCQYPPWFCYLVSPFYALWGRVGMRIVPLASGVGLLFACYGLARQLGIRRPAWAAAAVLFAAPILPYCYIFWDIVPALAAGIAGLYFVLRALESPSGRWMLPATACLLFAFVMREEYVLWAGSVFLAAALVRRPSRSLLLLAAATFGGIGAVMLCNRALVGHDLFFHASTGSGVTLEYSWALATRPVTAFLYLARVTSSQFNLSAMGDIVLFFLLCALAWLATARRPDVVLALSAIGLCAALLVRFYLWDNAKPLYTQSYLNSAAGATPLLFAGLRLWSARAWPAHDETRKSKRIVATASLTFLLASVWLSVPASAVGMNFGPRLLLPAYPGLLLAVFAAVPHWYRGASTQPKLRLAAMMFGALVALGVVDNGIFLQRLVLKLNLSHRTYEVLRTLLPNAPILTDQAWLPSDPPELFYERPILLIRKAEHNPALMDRIVSVAKALNSREALVLSVSSRPPAWIRELGEIEPIPIEERIRFPDGSFRTHAFRLIYR